MDGSWPGRFDLRVLDQQLTTAVWPLNVSQAARGTAGSISQANLQRKMDAYGERIDFVVHHEDKSRNRAVSAGGMFTPHC